MFLRTKSPLYGLEADEAVVRACSTLGVCPEESSAKLLTIWKVHRLIILTFDMWNDGYDWSTAHRKVNLPVLLIDYGKRLSSVKVGSHDFKDKVNGFVARQHELHGWDARPPYFQDQTGPGVPTYGNPRSMKMVQSDGKARRAMTTPPPER